MTEDNDQHDGAEDQQTTLQPKFNAAVAANDKFAGQLLRLTLDELRQLPDIWAQTSESKQEMVIGRLRSGFETVIVGNMAQILAAGMPHAEVHLKGVASSGDAIKATVIVPGGKTLHDVIDFIGRKVTLVLVDVAKFTEGMEKFRAQADQHELALGESDETVPEMDASEGSEPPNDGLDRTMIWWQNEAGEKWAGPRCEMPAGCIEVDPPAGSESEKQQLAAEASAVTKTPEEIAEENKRFADGLAASLGTHVNGQTGAIDGTSEASRNARRRNARG